MAIDELKDKYICKLPDSAWYLVRVVPRAERRVEIFFKTGGIPCYLPYISRVYSNNFRSGNGRSYSYKKSGVPVPMFPGYIFAALDADGIRRARMNRHVCQVCLHVGYTEDDLISDLHAVQDFEFLSRNNAVEICGAIQSGTAVVINSGAFAGWEGVVEKRMNKNFVFVRIRTLEASIGIECAAVDCDILPEL